MCRPILAVSEQTNSPGSIEQHADPQEREAIKQQDGRGITPSIVAAEQGDTATVRLLLASGAAIDQSHALGRTALYAAAICDSRDIVSLLLDAGAAVDQPCADGMTPLIGAALAGCTETVRLLPAAGADCSKSDESDMGDIRMNHAMSLISPIPAHPMFLSARTCSLITEQWVEP